MQKMMFDEEYGMEQAVLEELKNMTRRFVPERIMGQAFSEGGGLDENRLISLSPFKVGETVAVAQSYQACGYDPDFLVFGHGIDGGKYKGGWFHISSQMGWRNKMYVRADLMKHFIEITDVRVERLKDISQEDALREGIYEVNIDGCPLAYTFKNAKYVWADPRFAFGALIDKLSGKGTFDRNGIVFVYSFKLIK